jgi:hypothetical protein
MPSDDESVAPIQTKTDKIEIIKYAPDGKTEKVSGPVYLARSQIAVINAGYRPRP